MTMKEQMDELLKSWQETTKELKSITKKLTTNPCINCKKQQEEIRRLQVKEIQLDELTNHHAQLSDWVSEQLGEFDANKTIKDRIEKLLIQKQAIKDYYRTQYDEAIAVINQLPQFNSINKPLKDKIELLVKGGGK